MTHERHTSHQEGDVGHRAPAVASLNCPNLLQREEAELVGTASAPFLKFKDTYAHGSL